MRCVSWRNSAELERWLVGWLASWLAVDCVLTSEIMMQHVAMYGLLYFYHAVCDGLAQHRPLAKLLCIKGTLFISFW